MTYEGTSAGYSLENRLRDEEIYTPTSEVHQNRPERVLGQVKGSQEERKPAKKIGRAGQCRVSCALEPSDGRNRNQGRKRRRKGAKETKPEIGLIIGCRKYKEVTYAGVPKKGKIRGKSLRKANFAYGMPPKTRRRRGHAKEGQETRDKIGSLGYLIWVTPKAPTTNINPKKRKRNKGHRS